MFLFNINKLYNNNDLFKSQSGNNITNALKLHIKIRKNRKYMFPIISNKSSEIWNFTTFSEHFQ